MKRVAVLTVSVLAVASGLFVTGYYLLGSTRITPRFPGLDLSKFTLVLNCSLPEVPDSVPRLRVEYIGVGRDKVEEIALNVFGFETVGELKDVPIGGLEARERSKSLVFFGLTDILYIEEKLDMFVEECTEAELRETAERFLERLGEYWEVPTTLEFSYMGVYDSVRSFTIKGQTVLTNRPHYVMYQAHVAGIPLFGSGAEFTVGVADGRVVSAVLRNAAVAIDGYMEVTVSPEEAIISLYPDVKERAGFGVASYALLPEEGEIVINNVEFGYYRRTEEVEEQFTYLPLVYRIEGVLDGKRDGIRITSGFDRIAPATEDQDLTYFTSDAGN